MINDEEIEKTIGLWLRKLFLDTNKVLESDCLTMALRLMGEDEDSFSPECREVMSRWRPRADAVLRGEGKGESDD